MSVFSVKEKKIMITAAITVAAVILLFVTAAILFKAVGFSIYRIDGDSMYPTLERGDCILVSRTSADELKIGDIITFYSAEEAIFGKPNTHRIISEPVVDEEGKFLFTTGGDNSGAADSCPVSEDALIGRMVCKLPAVEWLYEKFYIFKINKK